MFIGSQGNFSPAIKWPGFEAERTLLTPSSSRGAMISTSSVCLLGAQRDNLACSCGLIGFRGQG